MPDRQLMLLDVSGHATPRAAVVVGNVDTADHVAVFTPGLESTVAGDLASYTRDMIGVRQTGLNQLAFAPGREHESVATVAWVGYDAPQLSTLGEADRSVAMSGAAQNGAADLSRLYQGIGTSRAGHEPHLTALGHSYGSTTTGYALQQTPGGVDDAVLFGSPGLGTDIVSELNVPAGHVNIIEARDDPVADLGRFGSDPNHLDGSTQLSAHRETGPNGLSLAESTGHSEYMAPNTTSQHNIAATVVGVPEQRITGTNTGLGDWLRFGWDAF